MATFIPLTHIVNNQPATLYVNVDQIVRIGDSVGGGPGYPTNILLANGQVDVRETIADIMQLINQPKVAAAKTRRKSA